MPRSCDTSDFDSGDYCRLSVNLFFYNKKGNQGISFGLQNVQKAQPGKRLAGGTPAREDFNKLESEDDDDPMEEDDITF